MPSTSPDNGLARSSNGKMPRQYWRFTLQAAILAISLVAVLTLLLLWDTEPEAIPLSPGEVASEDFLSPTKITYVSDIATESARAAAANNVKDIYTDPDTAIIEDQLQRARDIFEYATTVRNDPYLSSSERVGKIKEISDLNVSDAVLYTAISFDQPTWSSTITTTLWALEQVMMQGIRENQLLEARTRLSLLLSSEILSSQQEKVVVGIARSLVKPTSFYDAEATEAAKEKAGQQVQQVERALEKGQAIVRAGDIVTESDLEELKALGLLRQSRSIQEIAGGAIFAAILVMLPGVFIHQLRVGFWARWRRLLLICLSMMFTIGLAKFMIPNHVLLPYLFPMAAISMLLTLLLEDIALSLVLTTALSLAIGFVAGGSLEMITLNLASGMVASLSILRREKLSAFLRAGAFVALTNMMVSVAFRLYSQDYDIAALSQLATASMLNGALSSSVTFATFTWTGRMFGITNAVQLLELARPTQPLLKQMALQAPGTYHHTVIVSNMAERAAEAIGANSLLARIGGYYHDIGKSVRPYFFIENSTPEDNIHSRLDPKTSAQIIISHVTDGLDLAKKAKLPSDVRDIIVQHHGTTLVSYFYQQACQQATEGEMVDEADFRYPGPKPQTKEAAIVMLADVEAAVRSQRPATVEETDRLVHQFINARLISGELEECDLTLRDLDQIRASFVSVLKGVFHPRIQYPSGARDETRYVAREPSLETSSTE